MPSNVTTLNPTAALRTGSQMIAEGAVRAGCRFFAGYPITPASGIYRSMMDLLQKRGDCAISSPDEISALAYCVGASMRGFKAMTATSGPGFALMTETIQYALMTEMPVVIVLVQRLGPSTGGATQGAQGDVLFAEFCTSGAYTIPMFAPGNAHDCFELTRAAFHWSEKLRTPVIVLADKEVCMTTERVGYDPGEYSPVADRVRIGKAPPAGGTPRWKPYDFRELSDIPEFSAVGEGQKVTFTGSAHNKSGQLKKNDSETLEVLHHLQEKIHARRNEMSLFSLDEEPGAETLVISYGITSRAMLTAVAESRASGKKVSSLKLCTLFPVAEAAIAGAVRNAKRVVIAEENMTGQYRQVLTPFLRDAEVVGVNKIGSMITPKEIEDAIA
jgi:2-oxoglutarate ferredoxin oxidoreductase subunit alpha